VFAAFVDDQRSIIVLVDRLVFIFLHASSSLFGLMSSSFDAIERTAASGRRRSGQPMLLSGRSRGGDGGRRCHGIGDDASRAELGGQSASAEMAVLALHVPPHSVVAGERARAVRARDANALMALADVRAQVRLVAIRSLAKRAAKLRAWKERGD
jgi:hypothetical protein